MDICLVSIYFCLQSIYLSLKFIFNGIYMGLAQASTGKPAAAAGQEVLAITSATHGHALEAAFVQGAQSVAARVQHSQLLGFDSASFQQLHTMLHDQQDTLLVGLLDDASATLVLDLVRSAGGRVLSEEHHRIAADATGWAQQLGQTLVSGQSHAAPAQPGHESRVALRCLI